MIGYTSGVPLVILPAVYEVRQQDSYGSGRFLAPRGKRRHLGTDFVVAPGDDFLALVAGWVVRRKRPYGDDLRWDGLLIRADWGGELTLFYVAPFMFRLEPPGSVYAHSPVGSAQDIRRRYPADATHETACTPHVHVQLVWPPGRGLPLHWVLGKEYTNYQGKIYVDVEEAERI